MSETKENLCPECDHPIGWHGTNIKCIGLSFNDPRKRDCPCTRTYESLVGEKGKDLGGITRTCLYCRQERTFYGQYGDTGCGCSKFANYWADRMTATSAKSEPSLQLLVIDMGNCCVVRVEKGEIYLAQKNINLTMNGAWLSPDTTFTELRKTIDGVKPVPRIERVDESYHVWGEPSSAIPLVHLSKYSYNALSALAGKPLPIWTGGTWEDLLPRPEMGIGWELPIGVWRYKRNENL